jgi:hypothetical protein
MVNAEHALRYRDVGETGLKQGHEIRECGNLVYVDSATVRAVYAGRILIVEGIEKQSTGPCRYVLTTNLDPRNRHWRTYPALHGLPARSTLSFALPSTLPRPYQCAPRVSRPAALTFSVLRCAGPARSCPRNEIVVREQGTPHSRQRRSPRAPSIPAGSVGQATHPTRCVSSSPRTPKEPSVSPHTIGRLMIVLHSELLHAPFQAWELLSERLEEAGLGPLAAPLATEDADAAGTVAEDAVGLLGYTVPSHLLESTRPVSCLRPEVTWTR